MAQELININSVVAGTAGWDATVQGNFDALRLALRTLKVTINTQGNTGTPSLIDFQLQDSNGNNLAETFYVRIRVSTGTGFPVDAAGFGLISASVGTVVETNTANKDLIFESNSSGLIRVSYSATTASTKILVTGHAPVRPFHGNANQLISVTH